MNWTGKMTKLKQNLVRAANLSLKPQFWYGLFGVSVCSLLVLIVAGLNKRRLVDNLSALKNEPELMLQANWPIQSSPRPLEWRRLLATAEADLSDGDYLIFTATGEQVPTIDNSQDHFVVDRIAYENFVPKSVDELVLLQLPETALKPVSENGAFVVLAAPWKVPADIPGEISYQVDSWNGFGVPAGQFVNNTATVWLLAATDEAGQDDRKAVAAL